MLNNSVRCHFACNMSSCLSVLIHALYHVLMNELPSLPYLWSFEQRAPFLRHVWDARFVCWWTEYSKPKLLISWLLISWLWTCHKVCDMNKGNVIVCIISVDESLSNWQLICCLRQKPPGFRHAIKETVFAIRGLEIRKQSCWYLLVFDFCTFRNLLTLLSLSWDKMFHLVNNGA
jgi:hypothetical protein